MLAMVQTDEFVDKITTFPVDTTVSSSTPTTSEGLMTILKSFLRLNESTDWNLASHLCATDSKFTFSTSTVCSVYTMETYGNMSIYMIPVFSIYSVAFSVLFIFWLHCSSIIQRCKKYSDTVSAVLMFINSVNILSFHFLYIRLYTGTFNVHSIVSGLLMIVICSLLLARHDKSTQYSSVVLWLLVCMCTLFTMLSTSSWSSSLSLTSAFMFIPILPTRVCEYLAYNNETNSQNKELCSKNMYTLILSFTHAMIIVHMIYFGIFEYY